MKAEASNRSKGQEAERLGEVYLKKRGYTIIGRNIRSSFGEIDLVARDKNVVVFIEVKSRRNLAFGFPEEAVNHEKRRRLIRLASWYLAKKRLSESRVRFDVLAMRLGDGDAADIRLIQNAFEANS
jgi:putative endonuclease